MRNLLLSTVTFLVVPAVAIAAPDFSSQSHTHTTPIELKPISSSSGIKLAGVCFLGVGDCDPGVGFGKGNEDYNMDTAQQCANEGFVKSCSSGYCMDRSCPYDPSYGKCLAENCPANSSTSCSGTTVGYTSCGDACNECCDNSCPSGYAKSTSAECYDTITNGCGETCYQDKECDPCPGYYDCGGTWQYCEGTTCSADSSRCSVYCESDHFPYRCDSDYGPCYGDYRDGYCSVPCDEIETDPCENVYCGSNASCSSGSCYCDSGYEGDADTGCTPVVTDPCEDVNCGSHASCSNGNCYCDSGYEGDAYSGCTEIVTDPCEDVNCGSHASCSNGSCYCDSGYEGNANTGCTPVVTDPCADVSCGSNAYCSSGNCYCNSGYEGDAYSGCTEIVTDPCEDVNCGSHASCSNGNCYCDAGYEGDAYSGCTEIDNCAGVSGLTCEFGCASYGDCNECTECNPDPCEGVTGLTCEHGCASTGSCGECTECNPDPCAADPCASGCYTNVSCYYPLMCGSRNSCGGCNECVNNPDCDVTSLSCSKGCASYNSCGKCIECRADPCDSRDEVTVPPYAYCSSYYPDCPTKCSGFSCNSGYTQVGNLCVNGEADWCPGGASGSTCMCGGTHTGIAYSNSHRCR